MPGSVNIHLGPRSTDKPLVGLGVVSESEFGNDNIDSGEIEGSITGSAVPVDRIRLLKNIVFDRTGSNFRKYQSIVFSSSEVPDFSELIGRVNRVADIGERAIRTTWVSADFYDDDAISKFPADISELHDFNQKTIIPIELDRLGVGESRNVWWARLRNNWFDCEVFYPAACEGLDSRFCVTLPLPKDIDNPSITENLRWDYAEALLTPTDREITGFLSPDIIRSLLGGVSFYDVDNLSTVNFKLT